MKQTVRKYEVYCILKEFVFYFSKEVETTSGFIPWRFLGGKKGPFQRT